MGLLSWWYSTGWVHQLVGFRERIAKIYDYFSIDLLVRTLFAPFRQISAGGVSGPMSVRIRAFFDKLISRFIGMFMRILMIIIGSVWIVVTALLEVIKLILWPLVPVLPVLGLVMAFTGWIPWQI